MDNKMLLDMLEMQKPAIMKESKKKFNTSLMTLIKNMRSVFPSDTGLATLEAEVKKMIRARNTSDLPLVNFAKKISETSGGADVGELIMKRDERVLLDPVVSISLLRSINIGEKWPKLSKDNQAVVWDLLAMLVQSAMQYMILLTASPEDMVKISMDVLRGKPEESSGAAQRVKEMVDKKLKSSPP